MVRNNQITSAGGVQGEGHFHPLSASTGTGLAELLDIVTFRAHIAGEEDGPAWQMSCVDKGNSLRLACSKFDGDRICRKPHKRLPTDWMDKST